MNLLKCMLHEMNPLESYADIGLKIDSEPLLSYVNLVNNNKPFLPTQRSNQIEVSVSDESLEDSSAEFQNLEEVS